MKCRLPFCGNPRHPDYADLCWLHGTMRFWLDRDPTTALRQFAQEGK